MIENLERYGIAGCVADGDIIEKIVPKYEDNEILEAAIQYLNKKNNKEQEE